MEPYAQAISSIIKEQQAIIGPVALEQAKKVEGLKVNAIDDIQITGNKKEVLGNLVNQYSKIFGETSVQVCKEAFQVYSDKIPASDVPDILKN